MAIESLSAVSTLQAQPAMKPQPVVQNAVQTTEGQTIETTPKVDATTVAVAKAGEKPKDYQESNQPTPEQLKKAIEEINRKAAHTTAQFGVHEGTNRITIKIVDKDTKKVIRELPPEKTLDMIAKAWELAGILVDEKR